MKQIGLYILLIIITSCKTKGKELIPIDTINVTQDIVNPQHYIVTKVNTELTIDGKADEIEWNNASFTHDFIDIEGVKIPKFSTKVKMLWDNDYLYVYALMKEPHIWGDITERDAIIYLNNDFEVFLDPSQTGFGYGEIEINALNTVWDLYLDKPYRVGGKANFEWDLKQLKSAVFINGSINKYNDIDNSWSLEIAIPLLPFVRLKNKPKTFPKENEQWKLNFSRVEWDFDIIDGEYQRKKENDTYLKEYNWVWSNQKVINMHEPEKWGILQFTEQETSDKVIFKEDPDMLVKQVAYALFRKTRHQDLKELLKTETGSIREMNVKYSESDSLVATFFKTNFGFEYQIKSPISKTTYIINEQGLLKTL
ncbi:Carbohydrate family 9 binding domain-like [Formosa sp. Hel1_31_208]|uniref:carbohydrate-binding family 9-like protein n=1 Tax=Formosa sp. Hel1_31_208 TaxID=1798225 RepID=UPI00087AB2EF|nr:carbohydrate-binding family 9-like protein [Formosa sp. Hel1_31_208]SDS01148.1 Carbohydrate family 9 binding domain-like [Formosa sp. Hel1_31_208]